MIFVSQLLNQLRFRSSISTPQNDHLNLGYVKDIYVDGRELARNGQKQPFTFPELAKSNKYICILNF